MIKVDSIVVGIDVHKYIHQAVAIDCFGQELSQLSFTNETLEKFHQWLLGLESKEKIIIALEDVKGVGVHLTQFLKTEGFVCRYVPAILTERERKHTVHRDKSDYLDAKRVAKVILTKSEETLPVRDIVTQDENIRELDLLLQERTELVREQTALKNQLHVFLHQYYGDNYRQEFKRIFSKKALKWYQEDLENRQESGFSTRAAILRRIARIQLIMDQLLDISEILDQTEEKLPEIQLLTSGLIGCGKLTACKILVEIGTIERFSDKAKLAKYAGIAPVKDQSSRNNRLYTNSGGNRKLNQAIHTIALSQIGGSGYDKAKEFYEKKCKEGKSKLWAIRCLKRHIVNRVFVLLRTKQHMFSGEEASADPAWCSITC